MAINTLLLLWSKSNDWLVMNTPQITKYGLSHHFRPRLNPSLILYVTLVVSSVYIGTLSYPRPRFDNIERLADGKEIGGSYHSPYLPICLAIKGEAWEIPKA
jgi:hypothetical protein